MALGVPMSGSSVRIGMAQLCACSLHPAQSLMKWDGSMGMCGALQVRGLAEALLSSESVLCWPGLYLNGNAHQS